MRKTKKPEPISDFQVLDKIFTLRDIQHAGDEAINPSHLDGRESPDSQGCLVLHSEVAYVFSYTYGMVLPFLPAMNPVRAPGVPL